MSRNVMRMPDPTPRGAAGTSSTPVWLKVVGLLVLSVVVVGIAVLFVGAGGHAPRPH